VIQISNNQTMKTVSNDRMDSFIEAILKQARISLHERSDDMLRAWHENIEEAHEADEDKEAPPLKLGISATVDLGKNTVSTELKFTVNYKSKISEPLPDPNQPEITGFGAMLTPGDSVEICVDGKSTGGIRKGASGKIHALSKEGSP